MGFREFFEIKSFKQKEAEQRQYNQWAFPYGEKQRKIVNDLILELMSDEKKTGLVVYLLGREAFQEAEREDPMVAACKAMGDQLPGKHRRKQYLFLALILADSQVDESLCYPEAETLRQEAKRLAELV